MAKHLDFDALQENDVLFDEAKPEELLVVGKKLKTVIHTYPAHMDVKERTRYNRVVYDKQHATEFLRMWERDADLGDVYFVPVNWVTRGILHQRRKISDIPKSNIGRNMFLTLDAATADVERRRKLKLASLNRQIVQHKQTIRVVRDF